MSYFDKYLKYKNKYLALKDTVGGSTNSIIKPFTYNVIKILWDKHTHNIVDYPALAHDFSEYCWIGPPPKDNSDYRAGFFLYKVKDDNYYFPGNKKQDVFRIYFIKPETDVDSIVKINSKIEPGPLKDRFLTTINLNEDIRIGTQYEWNHKANAWIYYDIEGNPTHKAEFGKKSSN
jgi:hypothetical protein